MVDSAPSLWPQRTDSVASEEQFARFFRYIHPCFTTRRFRHFLAPFPSWLHDSRLDFEMVFMFVDHPESVLYEVWRTEIATSTVCTC
jgi:hypothetical protein